MEASGSAYGLSFDRRDTMKSGKTHRDQVETVVGETKSQTMTWYHR